MDCNTISYSYGRLNGQLHEDTGNKVFSTEKIILGFKEKSILEDLSSIFTCVVQICMAQYISEKASRHIKKIDTISKFC